MYIFATFMSNMCNIACFALFKYLNFLVLYAINVEIFAWGKCSGFRDFDFFAKITPKWK